MKIQTLSCLLSIAILTLMPATAIAKPKTSICQTVLRQTLESLTETTSNHNIKIKLDKSLQTQAKKNAVRIADGLPPLKYYNPKFLEIYFDDGVQGGITIDPYSRSEIRERLNSASTFLMREKSTILYGLAFLEYNKRCYGSLVFKNK